MMLRRALAVILLMLVTGTAAAQSTRVAAIEAEQREKAKQLAPEDANTAERIIVRVMNSPLFSGDGGAYPWFGSVYGGSGFAAGGGYLRRLSRGASASAVAGISINNSKLIEGRFVAPELRHGSLRLDMLARWLDAKDVDFYGFGPSTEDEDDDLDYDFRPAEIGIDATAKPVGWARLGAGYSRLAIRSNVDTPNDEDDDDVAPSVDAPGIGARLDYNVVRGTAAIDWRTSPGYSTRGGLYRLTLARHHEANGLPHNFTSTELEVVQLAPLVREQFVFALRGLATFTRTDSGHRVPVMLAPFLGSGSKLRGFGNHRFTDSNRALVTGEYRWRPSRYLDMAIFMDAGQVAADRRDFRLRQFETSYGIGGRFHGPTFNALRVEVARSREGLTLILAGSQAF